MKETKFTSTKQHQRDMKRSENEFLEVTDSCGEEKNDDSNPQQGNTNVASSKEITNKRHYMMKVPPTKRDNRKLFVGGLPGAGK